MFEKILGRLLNQLLVEYVEGFDSNNLNLSLWTGEVNIENVRLKKDILIKLGLPISVKYSFIRSLRLKIPWKSLTSNKTEVYIDGVYAVLGYIPESEWTLRDEKLVDKRKKEIEDFRTAVLQRYSDQM
jgi:vacuolar protein sorting-associated protein 13A/C